MNDMKKLAFDATEKGENGGHERDRARARQQSFHAVERRNRTVKSRVQLDSTGLSAGISEEHNNSLTCIESSYNQMLTWLLRKLLRASVQAETEIYEE